MLLILLLALLGAAFEGPPRPDAEKWRKTKLCANRCSDIFFECKDDPKSDNIVCGASYADCLGYNPLGQDGQLPVVPTACYSAQKGAPRLPQPTMELCARKCLDEFEVCRNKVGANPLACASHYASCLGFSPFPTKTNKKLVPPTACSKRPSGPAVTKSVDEDCAEKCVAEYYECKNTAASEQPTWCAAEMALCLGYSPFDRMTFKPPTDCLETESNKWPTTE
ncbi:hypothetical protein C2857_000528 [Epichloe festucae Fl1]|uniref:Uncharacterized protein n=1 Tax=Epichloe festucae (strain Fl1) TaxID=877507 RepID=A0A7S9PRY9_EPIFF|nr:hypothetical protein C2857_000528 [Epichloe festucae Fl1]